MKTILLIFFGLCFFSLNAQNDSLLLNEREDSIFLSSDKKEYKIVSYYGNGIPHFEENYKNKTLLKSTEFDQSGKIFEVKIGLSERNDFDVGQYFLYYIGYYSNGKMKWEQFTMGECFFKDTLPDTKVEYEAYAFDYYLINYYETGNKSEEYYVLNRKKNGAFKEYYENGNLKRQGYYYNGVLKGILYNFNLEGNLIKADSLFLNNNNFK